MSQIQVKFDHTLEQSPIILPLVSPGPTETDDTIIGIQTQQTKIYGVATPLLRIGDIVVDFPDIRHLELNLEGSIPSLYAEVTDTNNLIKGLNNPGSETEVRLQIIPRFDNAYKKIDLTFFVQSYTEENGILSFDCAYKVLPLYQSQVKCYGELTTYEFFETISKELGLGFATNVESSNDLRYIYCAQKSYISMMSDVISSSGDSGNDIQSQVLYDWWIDPWNNVNFVDVYERFLSVDTPEEMQIYISPGPLDVSQASTDDQEYTMVTATLTNNPMMQGTDLYVHEYETENSSMSGGSDRVISTYSIDEKEAIDYLIQDGDQKKDIFVSHEYLGECYREFDYLLAASCRNMLRNKLEVEKIIVTAHQPLFAIPRGSKVNLKWFDKNENLNAKKQLLGVNEEEVFSNIPLNEQDPKVYQTYDLDYRLNRQISGQYLVLGNLIMYDNATWYNKFSLVRPRDQKCPYIDLDEEIKQLGTEMENGDASVSILVNGSSNEQRNNADDPLNNLIKFIEES